MKYKSIYLVISFILLSDLAFATPKIKNGVLAYHSTFSYKKTLKKELSQNEKDTLKYLNSIREKSGLNAFQSNNLLNDAAYNHANYMNANKLIGHYETSGYTDFTGANPWDRAAYTGYPETQVSENLSYGQEDYTSSIDGLFSAIYHRFGFLDFNVDEIGIGIVDKFYVYDMSNSYIKQFCKNPTTSNSGYGACVDGSIVVPTNIYYKLQSKNPKYVLFPYPSQTDIAPSFYEESPNPLPDFSVSGYPASISFNSYFYQNVLLESFKLYKVGESGNTEVDNTRILTKDSDPNSELSDFEYAVFPLERLEWNTFYKVVADFNLDTENKEFSWYFETKALKYPWFEVGTNSYTFSVKNEITYALYMMPSSPTDVINAINYSYSSTLSIKRLDYLDQNTILIKVLANQGDFITLKFANRSVTLNVSDSDNANKAMKSNVTEPQQNTYISLYKGWNLVEGGFDLNNSDIKYTWKYKNDHWAFHSRNSELESIANNQGLEIFNNTNKSEGIWTYSDANISILYGNTTDMASLSTDKSGWSLLGASKDTTPDKITCQNGNIKSIWSYINNSLSQKGWQIYLPNGNSIIYPNLKIIKAKKGFWVNCK